jgi:DNA-directed RNA polymerase specialized sigma24 family protein
MKPSDALYRKLWLLARRTAEGCLNPDYRFHAEDVASITLQHFAHKECVRDPEAWTKAVAKNVARRICQREKRYVHFPTETIGVHVESLDSLDASISSDDESERGEVIDYIVQILVWVNRAISELNPVERELLSILAPNGKSAESIAAKHKMMTPSVMKKFVRLLARIRDRIELDAQQNPFCREMLKVIPLNGRAIHEITELLLQLKRREEAKLRR